MKHFFSKTKLAYYLFTHPVQIIVPPWHYGKLIAAKKMFRTLVRQTIQLQASKPFVAYVFNPNGQKRALVVHGWMSKSLYMIKVIETLIEQGYQVIALDLPGHGSSPKNKLAWQDSVNAILKTQDHFGTFDLALGHSFGGAMLLAAAGICHETQEINGFLSVPTMIVMSAPAKIEAAIQIFSSTLSLSKHEKYELTQRVEQDSKLKTCQIDGVFLQLKHPTNTQIYSIHDMQDLIVPVSEAQYLSTLGDRVTLITTRNLGHIKVLYDKKAMAIIKKISLAAAHCQKQVQKNVGITSQKSLKTST